MPITPSWLARMLKPFRARRIAREMDDEMRTHIAMETDALVRAGLPHRDAARQAALSFGGVERFKDEARDAWPFRFAERIVVDLRFALRSLRRSPSFTLAAVLALALGMAANSVVFSAVDSVAFRPLAVRAPEQLVALFGKQGDASLLNFSYPAFEELRRFGPPFSEVAAVTEAPVSVGDGLPTSVWAAHVSDDYFDMLGVEPELGLLIHAGDQSRPVAVISHALWVKQFGAKPSTVGQSVRVNGTSFTVIGVAPPQFTGTRLFTYEPALWLPIGMHALTIPSSAGLLNDRMAARFLLIGRLQPRTTLDQARPMLDAFARRLSERYPDQYRSFSIQSILNRTPINPWLAPPERIRTIGRLLMVGVSLLLLVACINVASLLLSRMTARDQEIAIRLSLGASRRRIVHQLLTESVVLAALGALASVPISTMGTRMMLGLGPRLDYASSWRPADEGRMLWFSIALVIGSSVIFGLAPALQSTRRDLARGLRNANAGRLRLGARVGLRELALVAQVIVAVTTLAIGSVFVRSLDSARAMDPGFMLDGAVAFTLDPQLIPAYDSSKTRRLYLRVMSTLADLPDVRAVGRSMSLPLDGNGSVRRVFIDAEPMALDRAPAAEFQLSAPGYFRAIATPLVEGRDFSPADTGNQHDVAVINETLAHRLWPHESPVGKQLRLESPAGPTVDVIGVARTSNYRALGETPRPAVWLDLERYPRSRTTIVVRGGSDQSRMLRTIQTVVHDIDPALPVIGLGSLRDHLSPAYAAVKSGALGASAFGVLALLLTASGIYGLVSYSVSQRRREIAIRMALGAPASGVVRLVAQRAAALALVGTAIGLAVAAFVPMGIGSMLYGVSVRDPRSLIGAGALFCGLAGVAALIPALRAARLDPVRALRLITLMLCAAGVAKAQSQPSLELGRAAYREHRSDDAIKLFQAAVAANEDSVMPHVWLGRAYVQALPHANFLRQPLLARRARTEFDRAVALDPKNADAHEDRATYYMYAPSIAGGGIDKARAEAEVLRAINGYRGGMVRAQIESRDTTSPAAEREFAALTAAYPDSAAPFNALLSIYQARHRFADAFAAIDRRRGALPGDLWGMYQLGKTAALSGERLDAGEVAMREYIRQGQFFPSATEAHAHYRLGMILEQRRDAGGARAEFELSLRLDPTLEDAKRSLGRLPSARDN